MNKYGINYPPIKYLISVDSDNDFESKVEFARILSLALKEEIDSESEIYSDGNEIEIQCTVNAIQDIGLKVVKEMCYAVSDVFEYATRKIGSIKIYTHISIDKDPCYQKLGIKLSEINYRKFQLKFIGQNAQTRSIIPR